MRVCVCAPHLRPASYKLIKKSCSPGDVGLHNSQGITPPQSCHVQELFSHKHDHNASLCDQAWKFLKNLHDAVSFKHVDENESVILRGVQEFFLFSRNLFLPEPDPLTR